MTQPNYLQVQNALDGAVAQCDAHPELSGSRLYRTRLATVRDGFRHATEHTDAEYAAWRVRVGEELKQLRQIKVAYDRVAERADEHGYDDLPKRSIVYTEPTQLFPLVDATLAWLDAHAAEWSWCATSASELRALVAASDTRKRAASDAYTRYTVEVRRRIEAYDAAVSLLREYIFDARREAGSHHPYHGVELDVL
jgi:hypothetical protein